MIEALDWVKKSSKLRPGIVSASLGGAGNSPSVETAINKVTNAGVVVVVAAGNSNADACGFSPAFVPSAITVGATDSTDTRSYFSNYGTCVDIWAPGSSVVSASHTSDTGTRSLSGTSMACPHVSGGAALILGADNSKNPAKVISDLLNDSVRNAISGLKSGDTNALLYVGGNSSPPSPTPPTPPTQAPSPPPSSGDCVHQKDCAVSPWCTNTGFEEWCRAQGASCPAPMCTRA